MEQENRGKSKQQMICSQFEVGKSPFTPSLCFFLSSSLHSGSSPLGERSEWKRWAESCSEAQSTAERPGSLKHVPAACLSTWLHVQDVRLDILLIKSSRVWVQKMCHHPRKRWKLVCMSLPPQPSSPCHGLCLPKSSNEPPKPSKLSPFLSPYVSLSLKSTWTTPLLGGEGSSGHDRTRVSQTFS